MISEGEMGSHHGRNLLSSGKRFELALESDLDRPMLREPLLEVKVEVLSDYRHGEPRACKRQRYASPHVGYSWLLNCSAIDCNGESSSTF